MLRAAASLHSPSKQFKGAGQQEGSVARSTENLSRVEPGSAGVASGVAVKGASPPVTIAVLRWTPPAGLLAAALACMLPGIEPRGRRPRLRGGPSSSVT